MTVGGLHGVQVHITPKSFPARHPAECDPPEALPCLPVRFAEHDGVVSPNHTKTRFLVLDDHERRLVVEAFADPVDITPIARLARLLTRTPINSVDWYIPRRLVELDIRAAEPLATTRLTRLLGLRLTHRAEIRLPLYAFQTGSAPGVLRDARRLTRATRIRRSSLASDPAMTHFESAHRNPQRQQIPPHGHAIPETTRALS